MDRAHFAQRSAVGISPHGGEGLAGRTKRAMSALFDLELFVAIAETGSFTAAARKCGLTRATLTRRLDLLEAHLATPLVNRTTRNLSLTEAGAVYLDGCRETLTRLRQAEAAVHEMNGRPCGPLRIACPILSVDHIIGPLVTSFAREYPEVQVELHMSSEPRNPLVDGCDLALQIGSPRSSSLIAHRLPRLTYQLVASPEYLAQRGVPESIDDLSSHDCIVAVRANGMHEPWPLRAGGSFTVERPKLLANAAQLILFAAQKGLGIALIARPLALEDLASGALQPVLEDRIGESVPVNLVYTASARLSPKVRRFVDFTTAWVERFAGRAQPDGAPASI
jgi:DNA-binding transcriptional LysR family regulator